MAEAYVVDAVRTPIGRRNGMLAGVRAEELAAQVLNGLVARLDVGPGEIEDVQMGCVSQVGEQALNIGRMSALVAGWPETVCGTSVDRQCGSSMQAAFNATAAVQAGHLDVVVAAGVESMSRVPMGSNLTAAGFEGFSPLLYERWEIVPQTVSGHPATRADMRPMLSACSPTWLTQPICTSSISPGSTSRRATSPLRTCAASSSARTPASMPFRCPIGVRTASTTYASATR